MIAATLTKGCMLFNTFTVSSHLFLLLSLTIYMKLVWFKMERNVKTAEQRKNMRAKKRIIKLNSFPLTDFFYIQLVSLTVLIRSIHVFSFTSRKCENLFTLQTTSTTTLFSLDSTDFFRNLKSRIIDGYSNSSRMFLCINNIWIVWCNVWAIKRVQIKTV